MNSILVISKNVEQICSIPTSLPPKRNVNSLTSSNLLDETVPSHQICMLFTTVFHVFATLLRIPSLL